MRKTLVRQKNVIPGIMKCIDSKTHPQFLLTLTPSVSNAIEAPISKPKITHPKLLGKLVIEKTQHVSHLLGTATEVFQKANFHYFYYAVFIVQRRLP